MIEVIVIIFIFDHLFAIILGFAKQSVSMVQLSVWLDLQLYLASPSRWSQLLIHLTFSYLIVLGLGLPMWIVHDYWLFCVTILDCPWLHQVVVCHVWQAIMHNFGRSMGRSIGRSLVQSVSTSISLYFWYRSCNHSPKQFKTESCSWTIIYPHRTSIRITRVHCVII